MLESGAQFYWLKDYDGEWTRVEKSNYAFVAYVTGIKLMYIEGAP